MLHLHDLNHKEIWFRGRMVDSQNCINDCRCEFFSKGAVELGSERGTGNGQKKLSVHLFLKLEGIKKLQAHY